MNTGRYALALVLKGMILADMGRVDEGLETMRQACEINKGWYVYYGPYLFRHGHSEEARRVLEEVEGFPDLPFFSLVRAAIYKEAGDLDKTFEYLHKGKRHAWYAWMVRIYLADETLQQDPRYYELLRELKLPPPGPMDFDRDL
jgi:hypothetical protein